MSDKVTLLDIDGDELPVGATTHEGKATCPYCGGYPQEWGGDDRVIQCTSCKKWMHVQRDYCNTAFGIGERDLKFFKGRFGWEPPKKPVPPTVSK